ncbi:3-hydroxyacyl-CoA dehydrogenase family protein [Kineosporia sp. J2-2]|uniref:3-hydroxyacyl-CoA dehydrogenase family protein n=1 Tax=Kineosporia corallincola TaxID=2835133 RepID=A0ABS5THM4_9ACTN|nr:3-hydroxyacyl-CoA dehydrogenase family protein [Kineosporia corallincola]MBT0770592.1 3-hydroxyacyl-CoA dehydrogenase family protein [Kineosporia corallincola]
MSGVPERVGVYGGGRMGAGIAHVFLLAGARVTVVESDVQQVHGARARVHRSLAKAAERGVPGVEEALGRLLVTTDPAALAGSGLVVEAVPERLELKTQVLLTAEKHAPGAVLATNTSSLPVGVLAAALARPERLVGLHFFNPVPVSALVEIVVADSTGAGLAARAREWVAALGRTAITVTDSPGFASSRLGVALALEAIRMLEQGVGTAEDIDTAMTLGYRHPAGPLRTTDIVGLDVRLAIAEHLAHELGPRFEPPLLLRDLVTQGHLGRKSGRGFYAWPITRPAG